MTELEKEWLKVTAERDELVRFARDAVAEAGLEKSPALRQLELYLRELERRDEEANKKVRALLDNA